MGEDMAILHNIFGSRSEEVVRYGGHEYESLSTRMEERDRCFAIDTQPNDHPFLVTYVDQNTVNQEYVPDLHHQVALLQNGCSVEGQDNAALMRSTQVVDEASLLQNGCCVEGQDNATSLRSVELVKEASLESEDDTTLSRSFEMVKEAALEQNECCMEGEDNATSSRSVEVVKEVALLQNECCVEVEDATLLLRSAEVVEGDEEANASELIEIDREQFCQNLNTRKENPGAMIRIDKDNFNQETSYGRENLCESVDPLKRKARTADVDEGDHGIIKRAFVRIDSRQLCRSLMRPGKDRLATNHNKVQILVPIYNEANHDIKDVGVELSEKHDIKEEPNPSTHQCAECSTTFKMTGGRHLEGRDTFKMIGGRHLEERDEGSEMTHSVQILDIAPLVEKGFVSPFVSSKKFHITMVDEESPEEGGGPTASDVFRADVLRIFRTPFDKEEYKELREAIKVGAYLDHHQDVKKKLKTFRYKRGKCLNILRGFFYWIQNLTREGSFQPWTDRQCLAVEPPRS